MISIIFHTSFCVKRLIAVQRFYPFQLLNSVSQLGSYKGRGMNTQRSFFLCHLLQQLDTAVYEGRQLISRECLMA